MTTTARKPIVYAGAGSAIDNYNSAKPVDSECWAWFDKNNKAHLQILSLARQAGWVTNLPLPDRREVADLDRISDFLKSEKSPVRKKLTLMNKREVSKIVVALEGVVRAKFAYQGLNIENPL